MEQTKYDVFISYSRKDYVDEHKNVIPGNEVSKIKEALTKAGITYWFDEEGIYSGENFTEKIVANIELSSIFIYLSTVHSNSSPWTSKEIACADEFGKHIIPVRIDQTPYNKKVMFRIADLSYIDYSNNPQKGIQELIRSINSYLEEEASKKKEAEEKERHRQEEEERKRKQKEEEEKKARIRGEIKELVPDGILVQERKAELIKEFVEKNRIIGETSKICPVCDTPVPIESAFCKRCGWQFPLMYSLYGKESLECDKKQLSIAKSVWRGWLKVSELMEIRKQLEEERTKLLVDYEQLTTDCKRHLSTIEKQEALIALHQQESISLKQKLDDVQNEYQLSVQTKERIENELKEELLKKQETIRTLETKVFVLVNERKKLPHELPSQTKRADKNTIVNEKEKKYSPHERAVMTDRYGVFSARGNVFSFIKSFCNNKNIKESSTMASAKVKYRKLSEALKKTYHIELSEFTLQSFSTVGELVDTIWQEIE